MPSLICTVLLVTLPDVALNAPVQVFPTHLVLQSLLLIVRVVVASPLVSVVLEGGLKVAATSVDGAVPAATKLMSSAGHGAPFVSVATAVMSKVSLHVLSGRGPGLRVMAESWQLAVWSCSGCVA